MSCKILYLESSYPINTRSQRIIDSFSDQKVHVCTWNRGAASSSNLENYSVYTSSKTGYGNKLRKLMAMFKYAGFFYDVLKRENPEVIICSHWDMLLIAALFRKNEKIIYDNVDVPEFNIIFIEKVIIFLEKIALKRVEVSLLASRFYLPLYEGFKCIVLENLPIAKKINIKKRHISCDLLKIGFVGSVRHYELLKNLIESTRSQKNIQLHIYGGGIAKLELEKFCSQNNITNVVFHGQFDYSEIAKIYDEIDILWAAYPHKSRNVKYAISNKFYESIFYSIPCLFSEKTELGDYVTKNKIGVTVDPYSIESIKCGILALIERYNLIHNNLVEFNKAEDITWNKNEKTLKHILAEIAKND